MIHLIKWCSKCDDVHMSSNDVWNEMMYVCCQVMFDMWWCTSVVKWCLKCDDVHLSSSDVSNVMMFICRQEMFEMWCCTYVRLSSSDVSNVIMNVCCQVMFQMWWCTSVVKWCFKCNDVHLSSSDVWNVMMYVCTTVVKGCFKCDDVHLSSSDVRYVMMYICRQAMFEMWWCAYVRLSSSGVRNVMMFVCRQVMFVRWFSVKSTWFDFYVQSQRFRICVFVTKRFHDRWNAVFSNIWSSCSIEWTYHAGVCGIALAACPSMHHFQNFNDCFQVATEQTTIVTGWTHTGAWFHSKTSLVHTITTHRTWLSSQNCSAILSLRRYQHLEQSTWLIKISQYLRNF